MGVFKRILEQKRKNESGSEQEEPGEEESYWDVKT